MEKTDFRVLSSDNIHNLAGVVYLPKEKPIGYLHIVHGMTEHIGRYDKFMQDMAQQGYICCGYDNLGHGNTALSDAELGYIAKSGGYELLARDVEIFSDAIMQKYGRLPYFLLGHSMGSFIARYAVQKYIKPDKLIVMGTGGSNPAAGLGLAVIAVIKAVFGDKHISPFIDKLAFGSYNSRFGGGTEQDPAPWLTNDKSVREKYYKDKFCSFKFTVSAMGDLIRLNKITNSAAWYDNIPKDVPMLLVSGEEDPVGDYGKGVAEVSQRLKSAGASARHILYPAARHEILNDSTYEQVKKDILEFLKA